MFLGALHWSWISLLAGRHGRGNSRLAEVSGGCLVYASELATLMIASVDISTTTYFA